MHGKSKGSPGKRTGQHWTLFHYLPLEEEPKHGGVPCWHDFKHQTLADMLCSLPARDKLFFYHKFLFWPVQAGVRNTHTSFPPCFLQRGTSRQELLCISICREDMTLLLQPVPFPIHEALHSLEVSDSLKPLCQVTESKGLFCTSLKVDSFLLRIERNIFPH